MKLYDVSRGSVMKKFILIILSLSLGLLNLNMDIQAAPVTAPVKKSVPNQTKKPAVNSAVVSSNAVKEVVQSVSPLVIVDNPSAYLNKTVSFSGEFVSFTSLGLDYKPAFRDGTKYIGILMRRSDVKDHTIPLSELKMFMTRELAEKFVDIDAGDTFSLTGKVFSTALGDPWIDIMEFKITNKKNKESESKEVKSKK